MALILPPEVPAFIEPIPAPLIVANAAAIEYSRDYVRVHILSRHCLGKGKREFRKEVTLFWTASDYAGVRQFSQSIHVSRVDLTDSRVATKTH